MAMFVYRPIRPTDKAWVFAGAKATITSGKTYGSHSVSGDAGSTAILGTPFIGLSPRLTEIAAGSTATVFANRKFSSPVSLDAGSSVELRFVHMTGLTVYNEGGFKAITRDLNFSGSTITVADDVVTNTTTGGAEEVPYATRIDEVSATLMYKAEAVPGSLDADAVWRISRLTFAADGDVTIEWAGGTSAFDKIWDNRLALSYS